MGRGNHMKVFAVEANGHYSGGMAIVAATSPAEAVSVASTIKSPRYWSIDYANPESCKELLLWAPDGEPRVIIDYQMGE